MLFSGHHDTWHYGVMDNGGANATMLEVARIVAGRRTDWRRGFRLCFWSGHSHGRYSGSAWYADHNWLELEQRCAVHVYVDSAGAKGNTVLADMPVCGELTSFAREVIRVQGQQELTGLRLSRAGDQSFWGIGVPSLFMTVGEQPLGSGENVLGSIFAGSDRKGAGFGWWWHTPDDTLDKMDEDLLVRDTRIYLHALWTLLTTAILPFDYETYAASLAAELGDLRDDVQPVVDLSDVIARVEHLLTMASALKHQPAGLNALDDELANAALMKLSRCLVPLDYTTGDRFGHDPALPQAADWHAVFAANVDGAFWSVQSAAPVMKKAGWGRVVTISSTAGLRPSLTGIQAYSAAKHALVGLTKQLSGELAPHGITVNSIAPGLILSNPSTVEQWQSYGPERQSEIVDSLHTRRLGSPQDIAAAALFLSSEQASWITGQVLPVDGGRF